jgi:ribosome-associated toxin RatA of RatAB toxin-antitoxin module
VAAYEREEEALVAATPRACFAAMTDFEGMPAWQAPLVACEVLSRADDGRPLDVRYEVDAKVRHVSYTLRHDFDEPHRIGSAYVEGDFRDMEGEWRFDDAGDGRTRVRLRLRIDPGRFVPGPIRRVIEDAVMKRALEDLRRHVEAP